MWYVVTLAALLKPQQLWSLSVQDLVKVKVDANGATYLYYHPKELVLGEKCLETLYEHTLNHLYHKNNYTPHFSSDFHIIGQYLCFDKINDASLANYKFEIFTKYQFNCKEDSGHIFVESEKPDYLTDHNCHHVDFHNVVCNLQAPPIELLWYYVPLQYREYQ